MICMRPTLSSDPQGNGLVDIIDFKWLMAGDGHRVKVDRLQDDPAYASACLALGAASHIPALRASSRRLAAVLGLVLPGR